MLEGYIVRLIAWTKLKARLHLKRGGLVYFNEREIWWASLGANIGYEQDGKHKNFERPVLILKKFNKNLFLALPLTTKKKEGIFYYWYNYRGQVYSVILWQIRALSSKRILRKIRTMPENEFNDIRQKIKNLL